MSQAELNPDVPILRIFKARAKPGCEPALAEKLATTSAQLVSDQPGLLSFLAAGPANDTDRDFVFATVWRDAKALKMLFGSEWRVSLLPPGYSELIEECAVEHYRLTAQVSISNARSTP
jgi:quinol monooxygenase YgiN